MPSPRLITTGKSIRALVLLAGPLSALAAASNPRCPVMTGEQTHSEVTLQYKNKEVRFCCQDCLKAFEAEPERYLANLPQFNGDQTGMLGRIGALLSCELFSHTFSPIGPKLIIKPWGILLAGGLLVGLRVLQRRNVRRSEPGGQRRLGILVGCLVLMLGGYLYYFYRQYNLQLVENLVHYATYYEFGDPPVPRKPDLPPRIKATFYRGNDERSPRLFNDGNYRTATFHLSLCADDGRELEYGQSLADRALFLRLEIVRAPLTAEYFWSPQRMQRMFLTQRPDRFLGWLTPADDRVDLVTLEERQRWEARFPIGRPAATDHQTLAGIVYVCEERHVEGLWAGSRFHFGMPYKLVFEGGRLASDSNIWMGSLYRLREVPNWYTPAEEWFSTEPIVEKTAEDTDDPDLLGITEHVREEQARRQ